MLYFKSNRTAEKPENTGSQNKDKFALPLPRQVALVCKGFLVSAPSLQTVQGSQTALPNEEAPLVIPLRESAGSTHALYMGQY